jgi:hypothetical protein
MFFFVVKASNKPIVTCFGFQLNPQKKKKQGKDIINTLEYPKIKTSNDRMTLSRRNKAYVYLIFSMRQNIM